MAREIICTNEDEISISLTDSFSPWLLQSCEGIYEVSNKITTSENTMNNGSTFQGSNARERNIILVLRDRPEADHQANREYLYSVFKPRSVGKFTYQENGIIRMIDYYVESILIDAAKRSRTATISLICTNPFFQAPDESIVKIAGWNAYFQWPHEFPAEGEEFGARSNERLKEIDNSTAADGIGITITVEANGPVTTPTIYQVEQGNEITIGTDSNPLYLYAGEKLIITTHTNNKHVYMVREGVKTEINEYLTEDSEFLQLMHGINTFGYSAVSGVEYISISIAYRYQYLGV